MFHGLLIFPSVLLTLLYGVSGVAHADISDNLLAALNKTSERGSVFELQKPVLRLSQRERGKKRKSGGRKRQAGSGSARAGSNPCSHCETLNGFVPPSQIDDDIRKMVGKYRGGGGSENVAIQRARGVIETGLAPDFGGDATCPQIDSEQWAIDYTHKRGKAALHKGIDIPRPRGTAIRAVAEGVVVGRFSNDGNRKGIEVMLRHTPQQTGLAFWTYSQYTHLLQMSPLAIGTKVKMGDEIGKTSNSGKMGRKIRRDALHFAILYSHLPEWSNDGVVVTPKDGYYMDPTAFYRLQAPYESASLLVLPAGQKAISVPYGTAAGAFKPPETKRIWPYTCG